MTSILSPYWPFHDIDGLPLEAGRIYVGEVDQDPRANPIAVYYDEALTQQATQPIRTIAGLPAYQGSPTNLYVSEAEYSIEVADTNGVPIVGPVNGFSPLSSASITASTGSGIVGYIQTGTGATARTVQSRLREIFSVKDYGAVGDNSTDDTTAIVNALTAANAAGGKVVFPPGIYRHTGISFSNLRFVIIEALADTSFSTAGAAGVRLVCTSATANHIALTNPHGVTIRNFQFETLSGLTPTAGSVINLTGTSGAAASCLIENFRIESHFNGILIDGVSNSEVRDGQIRQSLGTYACKLIGSTKRLDQIRLKNIIVDTEVTGGSTTCDGFLFDTDVHTVFVEDCSALKCKRGFYLSGATPPEFVYLDNAEAENCNSHGFLFDNADHLRMNGGYASDNSGSGIVFGATFDNTARLIAPDARANDENGILIQGSGGIEIIAPRIGGNSVGGAGAFNGIAVAANVGNFGVIGGKVGGDVNLSGSGGQAYGILVNAGTSNNYRIIGVDLQGNATSGLSDGGTGTTKKIVDNLGAADYGFSFGSATVTTGNTTGVFAHGLGATPTNVVATPNTDPAAGRWWVTSNSTQCIVTFGVAVGSDVTFSVQARL